MGGRKVKGTSQPCPCVIKSLEVACEHGRKSNDLGMLQIVSSTTMSKEEQETYGPEGLQVIVTKTVDYGGADEISAKLKSGRKCRRKIKVSGGKFPPESWKGGTSRKEKLEVEPFYLQKQRRSSLALLNVLPVAYDVTASTVNGQKTVTVEQYPSDKLQYKVDVDGLGHIAKKFNDAWQDWGKKAFGWSPAKIEPKIITPVGSLSASECWKEEDSNWTAYHEFAVEAGLDPLAGIEVKVEVSMMACAGAAVGIPPPLAKALAEWLMDIIVGAGIGVQCKMVGNMTKITRPTSEYGGSTDRHGEYQGNVVVAFEGSFFIELTWRAGSDYIVSVKATGQGRVTIANENELKITAAKLGFQPSVKLKPITLSVTVVGRAFYIFTKSKKKAWKLWKRDVEIWKGRERVLVDFAKLR